MCNLDIREELFYFLLKFDWIVDVNGVGGLLNFCKPGMRNQYTHLSCYFFPHHPTFFTTDDKRGTVDRR